MVKSDLIIANRQKVVKKIYCKHWGKQRKGIEKAAKNEVKYSESAKKMGNQFGS